MTDPTPGDRIPLDRPLRFAPLLKVRVLGGDRLKPRAERPPADPVGESWELCDRDDSQSVVVSDGPARGRTLRDLFRAQRDDLVGRAVDPAAPDVFPLLLKLLDPREDLSVQVHPDDALAARRAPGKGELGKTEAWIVLESEPGGQIYRGFREGVGRDDFVRALADGSVAEILKALPARSGDVFNLPAGMVHALGAGVRIAEIQQNSDTTYRVFDWNRVGLDGRPRELHIEDALAATRFDLPGPDRVEGVSVPMAGCRREMLVDALPGAVNAKFTIERFSEFTGVVELATGGKTFHLLTVARGGATVATGSGVEVLGAWDSVLVPAAAGAYRLTAAGSDACVLRFGGVAERG